MPFKVNLDPRASYMKQTYYLTSTSDFGEFALVWWQPTDRPVILQVYLPGKTPRLEESIKEGYPLIEKTTQPLMEGVAAEIRRYLKGEVVNFNLQWLDWDRCAVFQARVLRAEYGIPRGWVSTYGRIATKLGVPGGSRAVGSALASNPFPLLIPCHRAVRSNGELGGYQGGLEMKKALLEMEGVIFRSATRVSLEKVYYQVE